MRQVRPHRSLLVRTLAASLLIAVGSVAATAWLAARTTAHAIRQEQGQVLTDDTTVYDTLVGYAATHPGWDGVDRTVRDLAQRTGRRITLTTQDRARTLARSGSAAALPARESAVVDPLHVDAGLDRHATDDRIDSRAVGPYRLTAPERRQLGGEVTKILGCLRDSGLAARIDHQASGRPYVVIGGGGNLFASKGSQLCEVPRLDKPTPTERKAFAQLGALAADCLGRHGLREVAIGSDFAAVSTSATAQPCVDSARREQLAAYVAAPALLFITDPPDGPTRTVFALSPANTARIAGAAGLVLLLTVPVTVLVGTQLVRPPRALAAAALHPTTDGQLRVPVTTHDEIGYLAAAFNDLTVRRALMEEQRKAMVSDVAHELRTPLSNIRSWLEAGQDGIAVPDQAFMNSLLAEALQLQHTIDDLQDLAAADADALRLQPEPLYVRDLLDHVAGAHRARADAAGIRLDVHTEGDPALTADPIRLRQAVTNLVSNSLRHTPADGSVTLRAAPAGQEGKEAETVVIEVADTGTGIAPEDLPLVFERFWRAERSRSRQTGGSGLGLAIVRQLMEAHGGTATARSSPGIGPVFTLQLPIDRLRD
ncbi:sensor histidine kinase [Streptomyces mirabilis]|uniref:sensor histidine kinase n=1 Tax=Streptomyces mirabilis TaxID=68239 RepID=UPI0036A50CC5